MNNVQSHRLISAVERFATAADSEESLRQTINDVLLFVKYSSTEIYF